MTQSWGYAAQQSTTPLAPFSFSRRDPQSTTSPSKLNTAASVTPTSTPLVTNGETPSTPWSPGMRLSAASPRSAPASADSKWAIASVSACIVDSCRNCPSCKAGEEQYCEVGATLTYGANDKYGDTDLRWLFRTTSSPTSTSSITSRRSSIRPALLRCSAPASPPTRRCVTGRSVRARRWASSGSAVSDTWA